MACKYFRLSQIINKSLFIFHVCLQCINEMIQITNHFKVHGKQSKCQMGRVASLAGDDTPGLTSPVSTDHLLMLGLGADARCYK